MDEEGIIQIISQHGLFYGKDKKKRNKISYNKY